jgi:hypothetical protein
LSEELLKVYVEATAGWVAGLVLLVAGASMLGVMSVSVHSVPRVKSIYGKGFVVAAGVIVVLAAVLASTTHVQASPLLVEMVVVAPPPATPRDVAFLLSDFPDFTAPEMTGSPTMPPTTRSPTPQSLGVAFTYMVELLRPALSAALTSALTSPHLSPLLSPILSPLSPSLSPLLSPLPFS